ncbi:HNH endonuclease [Kribbella voronezhensis]|uniref:HNH endonuclease n=1 Tax=Kribbella voronezhensis TaxID=2512212 RepID=A0A4R7T784_9ACTN|nr:HNH endonuclease signature motif containing protein [Kribbella voronezhensis]TDU87744.1 HNH endonuclease [Kribbella voronezhensis]
MELEGLRPAYLMSGEEALATLDALHAQIALLETYSLEVMSRLDDTGYAKEIGAHDTARLLATRHRKNLGGVRRDLALALALPKYAAVSAALPDPHAVAGPDPTIQYAEADPDANPTNAPLNAPTESADADDTTPDAHAQRLLPVILHKDQAQSIVAGLEAIPPAAMVPVEDIRIAEEQMVEAARHLTPRELTLLAKQARNLLDTDGPEPAEDAAARREAFWLKNADQGVKFGGYLSSERAALLRTLIEPAAKPRKTIDGEPDPRSREKRQADRFTDILHLAAETAELPSNGGVKPHITVTMDLSDLVAAGKDVTGDLLFGESLSAGAVRRLACDAEIIPIVLDTDSAPLDVGRAKRLITPAMRKALNLRDKGCVVCGAAPIYCDAHHIISWLDGGPTSIDNLALFCRAHHTDVDKGHYTVTITNGTVHLTRPTWADPPPPPHPPTANPLPPLTHPLHPRTSTPNPRTPTTPPSPEPPHQEVAPGNPLHPHRTFPLAADPPPLTANSTFDPWSEQPQDTSSDDPSPLATNSARHQPAVPATRSDGRPFDAANAFDPWAEQPQDTRSDAPRPLATNSDPHEPAVLGNRSGSRPFDADPALDPWGTDVLDTG